MCSRDGVERTGIAIACLRKCQNWSYTNIIQEVREKLLRIGRLFYSFEEKRRTFQPTPKQSYLLISFQVNSFIMYYKQGFIGISRFLCFLQTIEDSYLFNYM